MKLATFFIAMLVVGVSHAQEINDKLFQAVASKKSSKVEKLLKKGADPNYINRNNEVFMPVLNQAVMDNESGIAAILLSKGASVSTKDSFNMTPLMWASFNNNLPMVQYLVEKGANIAETGKNDKTCLDIAIEKQYSEIMEYLSEELNDSKSTP